MLLISLLCSLAKLFRFLWECERLTVNFIHKYNAALRTLVLI